MRMKHQAPRVERDHRLRKRYTALLREEVGGTVSDPEEIDEVVINTGRRRTRTVGIFVSET